MHNCLTFYLHRFVSEVVNGKPERKTKDALVFMAVGVSRHFKIPMGYFLIDGLSGGRLSDLIKECLQHIHIAGI